MLVGKNGGGYQYCHLFAIRYRFECRTYGDLCFAEAYIATNEPIHGSRLLHILLHGLHSLELVGRLFVDKGGLQLML